MFFIGSLKQARWNALGRMRAVHLKRALILLYAVLLPSPAAFNAWNGRTISLGDNGHALINPGMGWVFHYYDNKLEEFGRELGSDDALDGFPGMAVAYLRLPWSVLEPQEGQIRWDLIDTPAQTWLRHGKRIAFRFTSAESQEPVFATPEWVKKEGAKGVYFEPGRVAVQSKHWEPDYGDAVFLAALDRFLGKIAARYDGKPWIDFIDVGSFGVWGEGHTLYSSRPYDFETVRRIIDLYRKNFPHTLLVCNDDFTLQGRGEALIDYCQDHGLTLRDDSILVGRDENAYLSAALAQKFWRTRPVILESQYYDIPRDNGYWDKGRKYAEAVEAYHASYVSAHWHAYEFLKENSALISRINGRLGYRLVIDRVALPESLLSGRPNSIGYEIHNAGVAPCLKGGYVAFTLRSAGSSSREKTLVDRSFNVKSVLPGDLLKSRSFELNTGSLPRGNYDLWLSIGDSEGNPVFALPLPLPAQNRRYLLGKVTVQ